MEIQAILENHKIVGAVYAVFAKDELIATQAFGFANIQQQRLMTSAANLRLASLSKLVTTTAVMQLAERGRLDLDADVADYLGYPVRNPRYPDKPITVRNLIMHTSSLADVNYNALLEHDPRLLLLTPLRDLVAGDNGSSGNRWYNASTFTDKRPSEYFLYSNLGYITLGSIVERQAGINFCDYCQKHIFEPLQMQASFDAARVDWKNTATLYTCDEAGLPCPGKSDYRGVAPLPIASRFPLGNAAGYGPQGGLMCSVPDYAKFMGMLANGGSYQNERLLQKSSCDQMQQLQWFAPLDSGGDNAEIGYWQQGLDLQVTDDLVKNLRLAGHGGDAYGLISGAYFDRKTGNGFVMAFNGGRYLPDADSPGFLTVETAVARAIVLQQADLFRTTACNVSFAAGGRTVLVDSRVVELPDELTIDGSLVPEITLNDILRTPIASMDFARGEIAVTNGVQLLKFGVGKNRAVSATGEQICLNQAPYYKSGHFFLPLIAVRDYFAIDAIIKVEC